MTPRAVLFDLFGTLVAPFPKALHHEAMLRTAADLGVDADAFIAGWVDTYDARVCGKFESVADNLAHICPDTDADFAAAAARYEDFTEHCVEPKPGVLDTLAELRRRGIKIGLVTNCAPDVRPVLARRPLGALFDATAFSFAVGVAKPATEIYRHALAQLDIEAKDALFVGDGSDRELSGAGELGLRAVLVEVDLTDTYDSVRTDVLEWRGRRIKDIPDVLDLL